MDDLANKEYEKVSSLVSNKPIKIEVGILPRSKMEKLLQKLKLKRKTYHLSLLPMTLGTRIRYTAELKALETDLNNSLHLSVNSFHNKMISEHGDTIIKALALAIHNKEGEASSYILNALRAMRDFELMHLLHVVNEGLNVGFFLPSIILITGINLPTASTSGKS